MKMRKVITTSTPYSLTKTVLTPGSTLVSSTTAIPNKDGTYTVYFGDCDNLKDKKNYLPTVKNWDYTFRTYGPGKDVSSGKWKAPLNPVLVK